MAGPIFFSSNRFSGLIDYMIVSLLKRRHPLSSLKIITPSLRIERYLKQYLLEKMGIFAGLSFSSFHKFSSEVLGAKGAQFYTPLELKLSLEAFFLENPPLELGELLKGKNQAYRLSSRLSPLFMEYQEWQEPPEGVQKNLFLSLFSGLKKPRYRAYENEILEAPYEAVHFFGFSSFSQKQMEFLTQLSKKVPLYYYFLSPSEYFWSDLSKTDANFLGFLTPLSRKTRLFFEEVSPLEHYFVCQAALQIESYQSRLLGSERKEEGALTLLKAIQTDFLLLRSESLLDLEPDDSLKVQESLSIKREVEGLVDFLREVKEKSQEIIVMAPQILDYLPFVEALFPKEWPYTFLEIPYRDQSRLLKGIGLLFNEIAPRFEKASVLSLLGNPYVQKKWGFVEEDRAFIKNFLDQWGVEWGINKEQKQEVLPFMEVESAGTYDLAFQKGLESVWYEGKIPFSKSEVLGRFIEFLHTLLAKLEPLRKEIKMTLQEGSLWMREVYQEFFFVESDESEGQKGEGLFYKKLDVLSRVEVASLFPLSSIIGRLLELLNEETVCRGEGRLDAIQFCSLRPSRMVPAQITALLGLDEESFSSHEDPLNQNLEKPGAQEEQKQLFLEALLLTEKKLWISYLARSFKTGRKQGPALEVKELLSYCDRAFTFKSEKPSKYIFQKQPLLNFDPSYFEKSNHQPFQDYEMALAWLEKKEKKQAIKRPFLTPLCPSSEIEVPLKQLHLLTKNPTQFYLNIPLKTYLDWPSQESLSPSPLTRALLRKDQLKEDFSTLLQDYQSKSLLGKGPIKKLFSNEFLEESEKMKQALRALTGNATNFEVELVRGLGKMVQKREDLYLCPAPAYQIGKTCCHITGKISFLTSSGFLSFGKKTRAEMISLWPALLLFHHMQEQHIPLQSELFFIREEKSIAFSFDSQEIKNILGYYFLCHQQCSPLNSEWVSDFEKLSVFELQDKLKELKGSVFLENPYQKWFLEQPWIDDRGYLMEWKAFGESLYTPLWSGSGI